MDLFLNDNEQGMMPDEDFMNHPGFLGGTFLGNVINYPQNMELKRYKVELQRIRVKCSNYAGGAYTTTNCDALMDTLLCYQGEKDAAVSLPGNTIAQRRVRDRKIKAANFAINHLQRHRASLGCHIGPQTTNVSITSIYNPLGNLSSEEITRFAKRTKCPQLRMMTSILQNEQRERCKAIKPGEGITPTKNNSSLNIPRDNPYLGSNKNRRY